MIEKSPIPAFGPAAPPPFTSIVIPVYDQLPYTQQCLAAIDAHTPRNAWEVIVVDNGSADGTPEWLSGVSLGNGQLRVIRNEVNRGFGPACNQGMDAAKGDGILLLNNDAIVMGDWLSGLWGPLLQDSNGGMSGPITNFGRVTQVRRIPEPQNDKEAPAVLAEWRRVHASVYVPTDILSGFCLLITREVIETLGGFDPCYGLGYFEDDDYSLRAKLAGFNLWICEGVLVYHHGAVTSRATGLAPSKVAHSSEKWAIFREKWRLPPDRQPHQFTVEEIRRIWNDAPPLYVPLAGASMSRSRLG